MNIVFILIVAALIHASWNAYVKNRGNGLEKMLVIIWMMAIIVLPFVLIVDFPSYETFKFIFLGTFAQTFYIISLARAYKNEDFSIAYPFARGFAPLLTLSILVIFFNEKISSNELIGIILIFFGILILFNIKQVKINKKNIGLLILFSISIVFYTLVDAIGVRTALSAYQYIVWLFLLTPIPLTTYYFFFIKKKLINKTFKENKKSLIIASIGSLTSYSLVLWAYTQAPIYYVASIRESSIIFASLIGLIFFKEKGLVRRLIAAFVLFAGVIMLELAS